MAEPTFDAEALTLLREIRDLTRIICDNRESCVDDLLAADAFRAKMIDRADSDRNGAPLWYGWVIVEAFRAGAAHGRKSTAN